MSETLQGASRRRFLGWALPGMAFAGAVARATRADAQSLPNTVDVKAPPFNAVGDGITDDTAAIQNAVYALSPGSMLLASGVFRVRNELYLSASNVVCDFRGATFLQEASAGRSGAIVVGDGRNPSLCPTNVTILGGEYRPRGDSAISYPSASYNPLGIVMGHNVTVLNPKIVPTKGCRGLSIQTNTNWGVAPYANIRKVRVYGLEVHGDGTAVDGIDVVIDGADRMVQDVYIEGFVEGCRRGIYQNTGYDGWFLSGVHYDVTVRAPSVIGVTIARSIEGQGRIRVLDATRAGVVLLNLSDCRYDLMVSGEGSNLGRAIDCNETASMPSARSNIITAHVVGPWQYGLLAGFDDGVFPYVTVDGAQVGIYTNRGYRSVWGTVLTKNCATPVSNLGLDSDSWGQVIDVSSQDGAPRRLVPPPPSSATAMGTAGSITWDSSYVYVCTSPNTWKRTRLSSW